MTNKEHISPVIIALIIILSATIIIGDLYRKEGMRDSPSQQTEYTDTIVPNDTAFMQMEPIEGLWDAMEYYEIHHPEIVYAQAVLESNIGQSKVYKRTNNLFGLYNSRKRDYYSFNHWSESVEAYKNMIQYRHNPPEDYYKFLERIRYAEDPNYTNSLRRIVKDEQRKRNKRDTISH